MSRLLPLDGCQRLVLPKPEIDFDDRTAADRLAIRAGATPESPRKVRTPRRNERKPSDATTQPRPIGTQPAIRLGSLRRPTARGFSPGLQRSKHPRSPRRWVSLGRMPPEFGRASGLRIHGIGRRWRNSSGPLLFTRRCSLGVSSKADHSRGGDVAFAHQEAGEAGHQLPILRQRHTNAQHRRGCGANTQTRSEPPHRGVPDEHSNRPSDPGRR